MRAAQGAIIAGLLVLSAPAAATLKGDFAGLAICSKLRTFPQGSRPSACNLRAPLRGECRFSLVSNGMPIAYLIEDGMVLDKKSELRRGVAAPYGLRRGESYASAAAKIKASTGLSSRHWNDSEEQGKSYLQSEDISCGANKSYSIYVWFRNGAAEAVSVSTLPAF